MSGKRKPGGPPPPDAGEDPLWRAVTQNTRPLRKRAASSLVQPPAADTVAPKPGPSAASAGKPDRHAAELPLPPSPQPAAPSPAPLDRRVAQRLARGRRDYDARLDLHGMRRAEAMPALLAFLRGARDKGHRLVLVITGKGRAPVPGDFMDLAEGGVLRRELPRWLEQPEFRALVAGVAPAPPRHGGDGAFSIHVRRLRETGA